MKKGIYCVTLLLISTLLSCQKDKNQRVKVIRDCTGTYLRQYEKDYHVCNEEILSSFPDNSIVIAAFEKREFCNIGGCELFHRSEGFVFVTKIN